MSMPRELEYSLLTSYSHCCRSCGNICTSFPWLFPPCRIPIFLPVRACCATRKWMVLHFRHDEAGSKIFTGYVASIVKRYKGREGDKVRRRTQVERDEGRNKDGDGRTVECRVSVQTYLTLPLLFVSVALLTLGPFSRAYISMSSRVPSRDMRHSYAGWWKSTKWKRAASMTRSLMRQKGLLFERIIISLRYVCYVTFFISLPILAAQSW